jgi:hypothetical protein
MEESAMEPQELQEQAEHAHHSGEKALGLTTAIVAVLLAVAALLSHRTHTEEVVLKGEANDEWAYYQAKNERVHMYEADAKMAALLPEGKELAAELAEMAKVEREGVPAKNGKPARDGTETLQEKAREKDAETVRAASKAKYFDGAELFLQVSIVLCSIALLAENKLYWKLSFVTSAVGIVIAVWGLLLH